MPQPSPFLALLALPLMAAAQRPASASAPAQAAPAPETVGPSRIFTPRDAFALSHAQDPQISPDGRTIAYTRATGDVMIDGDRREIWLIDVATGRQRPLGVPGSSRARWSPDGTRIAFAARGAEGERPQLWVHFAGSGTNAALTALPDTPSDMAWSPDGRRIGFVMFVAGDGAALGTPVAKPEGAKWAPPIRVIDRVSFRADGQGFLRAGYSHVFAVAADGGAARQLTFGPYDDGGSLGWAGNDRLLFSSNRAPDRDRRPINTEVFAVDANTAALAQLTRRDGPDNEPAASPDGRLIAYVGFDDRLLGYQNGRLSVMNADGGGARVLTASLDRDVSHPVWARDGRSVYVQYDDRGTTRVARVGLDGRVTTVADGLIPGASDRPYSGGGFSVAGDGTIAFTAGNATTPAEVAVTRGGNAPRVLTRLNADLFAGKTLAQVRPLPVTSSAGGLPVDAWMVTPPDYRPGRKYPMILEIHGGPFASYGPAWATGMQLYAAAGYVVVYANPRGSTSYGEEFANRIHHNYPSQDYDDLMSAVDAAIATGSVDPDNLFVTGGSGGGLLTAWIVGKTNRFRAAVSQKPVINWVSEVLTTDGYSSMARYWFGAMPWEDPQAYWRRSPLSLVGNVRTPTAVLVGEDDQRTPPGEAEQYYAALQLREVPTVLIRVPSASHGSLADRPSQLTAEYAAILAWFDRYRKR